MLTTREMTAAVKAAKKSDIRRHKVVAIAVWPGRVVTSSNRRGAGRSSKFSWHAEELLLRKLHKLKAVKRWGRPVVFVLRFAKDGSLACSLPCPKCYPMIVLSCLEWYAVNWRGQLECTSNFVGDV